MKRLIGFDSSVSATFASLFSWHGQYGFGSEVNIREAESGYSCPCRQNTCSPF